MVSRKRVKAETVSDGKMDRLRDFEASAELWLSWIPSAYRSEAESQVRYLLERVRELEGQIKELQDDYDGYKEVTEHHL